MSAELSSWPTPEKELLLRAALLAGEPALEAWQQWRSRVDIEQLDPGSYRVLPLLFRNLGRLQVQDAAMGRLKGIYRLTWYQNQMRFHAITPLLHLFHEVGIPTMVLKGTALTLLYYRDYGLRPMSDCDLLVPTARAREALDLLKSLGWKPSRPQLTMPPRDGFINVRQAVGLAHDDGREFDMHWHALLQGCYKGADDDFWSAAIAADVHGAPTTVLNPADELLHTCVHGMRWNPVPPLRWLADATTIIRQAGADLDWGRLVEQAKKRRLILPVRETLAYVQEILQVSVPSAVVREMTLEPVSEIERLEHNYNIRPYGILGGLPANWFLFLRAEQGAGGASLRPQFAGFGAYLRQLWNVESRSKLAGYIAARAVHRVRAASRRRLPSPEGM
jgi:hypothetical protein